MTGANDRRYGTLMYERMFERHPASRYRRCRQTLPRRPATLVYLSSSRPRVPAVLDPAADVWKELRNWTPVCLMLWILQRIYWG